jgi:hypothetical protein
MKEKEIRDKLSLAMISTYKDPQITTVKYACPFPSGGYVYAAPMPCTWAPPPTDFIPYTPYVPPCGNPEPARVDPPKSNKSEVNELVDNILGLKGQTAEIYKLKALACAVRDRVDSLFVNKG